MSITFCIFNLLPVYPLDGFRVVDVFAKKSNIIYRFLRYYGRYVLYTLFALSILADFTGLYQLDILGIALSYLSSFASMPIVSFWGLIF